MIDYSKWENLELSEDEADSELLDFLRERKEMQQLRLTELEKQHDELLRRKQICQTQVDDLKEKLNANRDDSESLKATLDPLLLEQQSFSNEEAEWQKKVGRVRSCFPCVLLQDFPGKLTPEESEDLLSKFIAKHDTHCREYGFLEDCEKAKIFLMSHPELISAEALNFMGLWAVILILWKKPDPIEQIGYHCTFLHFILKLAEQSEAKPRDCVVEVFEKIHSNSPEFRAEFAQKMSQFVKRIKEIAEEEAKFRRLGPGGLDPEEVLAALPPQLKASIEADDMEALLGLMDKLPNPEEASYCMRLLKDSGLWNPSEIPPDVTEH